MNPLDLISAAPWTRVAFTTYALSLSFFEAVLLDALLRGGGRNALILTDPEGVRAALSEEGARRVGRDYEIEPVASTNHGVFHPKIGALFTEDDAHLLVGSGNLTFAGWGGNLELVEHLHPTFAADAFDEAAGFFEQLARSDQVITSAGPACESLAASLRRSSQGHARSGDVHLLHSLDAPIAEQLALYADDLGGVTRLTTISPYYDLRGEGLEELAQLLGCESAKLHAHPAGTVRGQGSNAWPFEGGVKWKPVNVVEGFGDDDRPLHAKSLELVCRKGRIVLSGSANVTHAGLFGRNIEAGVMRIQRGSKSFWTTTKGIAPARSLGDETETDPAIPSIGILSASLEGETIRGCVLAPRLSGKVRASLRTPRAVHLLEPVQVASDGRFALTAPGIELESWENGRLILQFEHDGKYWEGFVSIAAALELIRRTGSIAPRLMAMLAGTETPADVAAILAWFRDDPSRMPASLSMGGGGEAGGNGGNAGQFVTLADLNAASLTAMAPGNTDGGEPSSVWRHAMALIRAAFTQSRGPWAGGSETDDDDDEDEKEREKRARAEEAANYRSLQLFDDLLTAMLAPEAKGRNALMALSLSHFLADRIRPAPGKVQLWLDKILPQILDFAGPESDLAIAAVLLHHCADQRVDNAIRARRYFLRRGLDPASLAVDPSVIPAFTDLLLPQADLQCFLGDVVAARTMGEQIGAFLSAGAGGPATGFETLKASSHWPMMDRALCDAGAFAKLIVLDRFETSCPRCRMRLPTARAEDLRFKGVTNCCGRILLNRDC